MAPLRYAAQFDPFLSLDCAPTPSTLAQSTERKGSNFAIWQHCLQAAGNDSGSLWQDPLFVDPATHNYALAEASPARDLGIEQIEVDNIGVQSVGKYHNK